MWIVSKKFAILFFSGGIREFQGHMSNVVVLGQKSRISDSVVCSHSTQNIPLHVAIEPSRIHYKRQATANIILRQQ